MMWFEHSPHGLREITEEEILARAEQIKARRDEVNGPVLCPWQMPRTSHAIPSIHNHYLGGYPHARCYGCPRR